MNRDFEGWAESEINRLRSEAQRAETEATALEHVLWRFRSTRTAKNAAKPEAPVSAPVPAPSPAPVVSDTTSSFSPRPLKKEVVVGWVRDSGKNGLERDLIYSRAKEEMHMSTGAIRALLWNVTGDGLLIRSGNKYFVEEFKPDEVSAGESQMELMSQ